ncbi:hypothetical protein DFQ27_000625, partial [Actinomortierella ambigua]
MKRFTPKVTLRPTVAPILVEGTPTDDMDITADDQNAAAMDAEPRNPTAFIASDGSDSALGAQSTHKPNSDGTQRVPATPQEEVLARAEGWAMVQTKRTKNHLLRVRATDVPGKTNAARKQRLFKILDDTMVTATPYPFIKSFSELDDTATPPPSQGKAVYKDVEYLVFGTQTLEQYERIKGQDMVWVGGGEGEPLVIPVTEAPLDTFHSEGQRRIFIHLLHPNTTESQVVYALQQWGRVASIKMGLNYTKTHAHATAIFEEKDAIDSMAQENIHMVMVGHGTGIVKALGEQDVLLEKLHDTKLAHLPFKLSPRILVERLRECEVSPKAVILLRDTKTGKPQMAARVYFETEAEVESAEKLRLMIDGKKTEWAPPNAMTCHECGSPGHKVNACGARRERKERKLHREFNSLPVRTQAAKLRAGFSFSAAIRGGGPPTLSTQTPLSKADFPALPHNPHVNKGKKVVRNNENIQAESSTTPNMNMAPSSAQDIMAQLSASLKSMIADALKDFKEDIEETIREIKYEVQSVKQQLVASITDKLPPMEGPQK